MYISFLGNESATVSIALFCFILLHRVTLYCEQKYKNIAAEKKILVFFFSAAIH